MTMKRKTSTAIVAGVTAAAMVLGGTFAWTSISQQATNESAGTVNVGGRLHDDFNGTNKDVYVENFTDPLNGGQPIYARVMLTEYMEIGQDAGGVDDGDNIPEAVPVVPGTKIDDVTTWKPHVPESDCAQCETTGTCRIHSHWEWVMGNDEAKVYMPTFNKDKDSLAADINGTYAGTNPNDRVYYDNYVTYITTGGAAVDLTAGTVDGTAVTIPTDAPDANALTEANTPVTSVTGNAQYDNDPDTDPNTTLGDDYIEVKETHTAKETPTAEVITMATWLADVSAGGKGGQPGNFWVYDTDGWAYWANPIMPGEATGLLLSNIEMSSNPGEKCYYAINVIGQFATVNDWTSFDKGGAPSAEAQQVLTAASNNVATVTVSNDGTTLLTPGSTYQFNASVSVAGAQTLADAEFQWSVLDADLNEVTTGTTIVDGLLTVSDTETNQNLIIVAKAIDDQYLGAVGLTSAAVDVKEFKIAIAERSNTSYELNTSSLFDGETVTFSLTDGTSAITDGVTWAVELLDGGQDTNNETLESIIDETTGVFTITADETHYVSNTYTYETYHIIKVTASVDGEEMASRKFVITLTGASVSGLNFYEVGTDTEVGSYELVIGKTYDVRAYVWNQSLDTTSDYITAGMDPIYVDGLTITVSAGEGSDATAAVVENGQFTATAAGSYSIKFEGTTENWGTVSGYTYVTVIDPVAEMIADINAVTAGDTTTVSIDGMEWYVLAKENNQALIWAAEVIKDTDGNDYAMAFDSGDDAANLWKTSDARTYLNGAYLNSLNALKAQAVLTTIKTAGSWDRTASYVETDDKVFLLTEADVFGTASNSTATNVNEYTLGVAEVIVAEEMKASSSWNALRSPSADTEHVAMVQLDGTFTNGYSHIPRGFRPAMWVSLDPDYSAG